MLIDERLHSLIFSVDSADAAPTQQQYDVYAAAESHAQPLFAQSRDRELISRGSDLVALNETVNKLNVPAIYVPEAEPEGSSVRHPLLDRSAQATTRNDPHRPHAGVGG